MAKLKNRRPPVKKTKPYGCHHQSQPQVRWTIRVESRKERVAAQPTSAAEDRNSNEPGQPGDRFLGLSDTDYSELASGRPEWCCRRQSRCDSRRHQRYSGGYGFLSRGLSTLEVLRQTSCQAGRLAPVRSFHFARLNPITAMTLLSA